MKRDRNDPAGGAQVYVNDEPMSYFDGMTVKFAIGPGKAKLVTEGALQVVDARGYRIGLGGSLAPGAKIFVVDPRMFHQGGRHVR